MVDKLIDAIKRSNFNAELYDGFMFDDFQFTRFFRLYDDTLKQKFDEVNLFLIVNGYEQLSFDTFLPELSITTDTLSLYADPYCNETDKQLILVIAKF